MERADAVHDDEANDVSRRDPGSTLVEILVAVVLLGGVVVAVLASVQMSIMGSRLERDHARAHQWLQSAIGVLQSAPRVSCDTVVSPYASGEETVRMTYQAAIRSNPVINPPGWTDSQLTIVPPVKVWDGDQYLDPGSAPQPCYDARGFKLQLITIRVSSPDGDIIETVEVVKDG